MQKELGNYRPVAVVGVSEWGTVSSSCSYAVSTMSMSLFGRLITGGIFEDQRADQDRSSRQAIGHDGFQDRKRVTSYTSVGIGESDGEHAIQPHGAVVSGRNTHPAIP
jgi:hypothetical protein